MAPKNQLRDLARVPVPVLAAIQMMLAELPQLRVLRDEAALEHGRGRAGEEGRIRRELRVLRRGGCVSTEH